MDMFRYVRCVVAYALLVAMPLLLSWGFPGCIGNIPCKPAPFTAQVRSYFLDFKPGSYWIYRNLQNGDIDSVYFVSENITQGPTRPECKDENSTTILKGFAGDKRFGYYITSWDNTIESSQSDIVFQSTHNADKPASLTINGRSYGTTISIVHCCVTSDRQCYIEACTPPYFRLLRAVFAADIGLVRWEAENYPGFGKVTYELVRSNIVR